MEDVTDIALFNTDTYFGRYLFFVWKSYWGIVKLLYTFFDEYISGIHPIIERAGTNAGIVFCGFVLPPIVVIIHITAFLVLVEILKLPLNINKKGTTLAISDAKTNISGAVSESLTKSSSLIWGALEWGVFPFRYMQKTRKVSRRKTKRKTKTKSKKMKQTRGRGRSRRRTCRT